MKKISLLTFLFCITLSHAAERSFKPQEVERNKSWHPIEDNEAVISGTIKWDFTIGYDRLVYVIKNSEEKDIRIPEKQIIVYNSYGIALARYKTEAVSIGARGVRSDKDYERFFPLSIIFKHSEIELPSDWEEAVWLEMLPVKED